MALGLGDRPALVVRVEVHRHRAGRADVDELHDVGVDLAYPNVIGIAARH